MAKVNYQSVDEYIATFPDEVQQILQDVRKTIREAVPEAEEVISYQMPAFRLHGMLVWYAAWKNHIGLYPRTPAMEDFFKKEFSKYEGSKGTIKFSLDNPIPLDLIRKIAEFRAQENLQKQTYKTKKKEWKLNQ